MAFMKNSKKLNYKMPKKKKSGGKIEVGCWFYEKKCIKYPTDVNHHLESCKN